MLLIAARRRDVGGLPVGRVLPHFRRRMVGPFIFFDHIGPATLFDTGLEVGPHPHIGLATVTYLFEGRIIHRDSLGNALEIGPGAVNWMTAGRGISHSERTPQALHHTQSRLHGVQMWVALPRANEQDPPSFVHHKAADIPEVAFKGGRARVIAGSLWGAVSPVKAVHPLFCAELRLDAGAGVRLERSWGERALFVVEGAVTIAGATVKAGEMAVADDATDMVAEALAPALLMLVGGAPLEAERFIWWNFVASDRALIEQAKHDWQTAPEGGRFGTIAGENDTIALPDQHNGR